MTSALPPTLYYSGIPYNNQFFQGQNSISTSYLDANYLKKVGIATSTATSTTFSGFVYVSGQGIDVGTQLNTLTTKTTGLSYSGTTSTFSGTLHGLIDSTSKINNINASFFDYNGSINSKIGPIGSITTGLTNVLQITSGLSFSGTTSTFSGSLHASLDNTSSINSITTGYYDPTSSIQTQINGKQPTITTSTSLSLNSITYTGTINTITPTTFGYISGLTSSAQTQLTTLQTKTTNMTYTSGATNFGTNSLTADSLNTTLTQLANYSISSGGIGSPAGSLTLTSDTSNNYKSVIMTYPDGNTYFDNWQNGGIFHFREQIAGVSTKYLFDLNSANATFSVPLVATDVYSTSLATQNNIATANNVGIASTASIGSLHVLNNVNCDSINVNSNCQYNYKTIGYITCRNFVYETAPPISDMIPLTKSILSLAKLQTYCGIINLSDLLFNYSPDVYLYLYPSYNLVMLDSVNNVIWSSDNTLGTDILYIQINVLVSDLTQIIIYNNNLPIL